MKQKGLGKIKDRQNDEEKKRPNHTPVLIELLTMTIYRITSNELWKSKDCRVIGKKQQTKQGHLSRNSQPMICHKSNRNLLQNHQ